MSKTDLSGILGFQDHSKCSGYISVTTVNPIVGLRSMFALTFRPRLQTPAVPSIAGHYRQQREIYRVLHRNIQLHTRLKEPVCEKHSQKPSEV